MVFLRPRPRLRLETSQEQLETSDACGDLNKVAEIFIPQPTQQGGRRGEKV